MWIFTLGGIKTINSFMSSFATKSVSGQILLPTELWKSWIFRTFLILDLGFGGLWLSVDKQAERLSVCSLSSFCVPINWQVDLLISLSFHLSIHPSFHPSLPLFLFICRKDFRWLGILMAFGWLPPSTEQGLEGMRRPDQSDGGVPTGV